ncbi:MAG: cold shock domain-containing protein, partial [Candidatus Heimdallarchaeota archaeon]|nr:cold shock domain-containing protein [Candidatus Heimdallarchaeota archaeon]
IFFHKSNLKGIDFDELTEGTMVEFELQEGQKGQEAVNISVVN